MPTIHAGKYVEAKSHEEGYFPEPVRAKAAAVGPVIQGAFGRAHARAYESPSAPTSGSARHGTNALEFVYMIEAGMSPADAIVTATINAAELCDLADEIGTLEPGKRADVIAVQGDPLRGRAHARTVRFVMKDGRVVVRP